MKNIVKTAEAYLKAGFNIVPTNNLKIATVRWQNFQKKPMPVGEVIMHFDDDSNIAILTGGPTRVICLDFDLKYDLSGDLWERFKESVPADLLSKLYLQKTVNNGYHLVFKVPASCIRPNEKLASRETTCFEKHQTYLEAFNSPDTQDLALKIASNDKVRVLIETRGGSATDCGGYFLVAPSAGYKKISGKIQDITEEECDLLMSRARYFNQVKIQESSKRKIDSSVKWVKDPFEHLNESVSIDKILYKNGWSVLPQNGKNIYVKRPGNSVAEHSGLINTESNIFVCYSTSTVFEANKGYTASGVFILLEADGSDSDAYAKLVDLGYGVH